MSLYEHGFDGSSDQGGHDMNDQMNQNGQMNQNAAQNGYGQNGQPGYGQSTGSGYGQSNPYRNPYGNPTPRQPKQKKPRKQHPFAKKVAGAAAIALVVGAVGGAAFTGTSYLAGKALPSQQSESNTSTSGTTLSRGSGNIDSTVVSNATTVTDVSDVVSNVMPAIVQVTNLSVEEYRSLFGTYTKPSQSAGSGIIISQDSDYIYIATNNHVVENATTLTITFVDGNAVTAEVQGTDPETDLGVVKVRLSDISSETMSAIKVATLGSSDNLSVGESAVVIGNALGYGQSVTTGVISGLDREVALQGDDGTIIKNKLIQTDAAVNPGNSGGALLNTNGEVVGIVSAKYSSTDVEGVGYAIPISSASSIIQSLMKGEEVNHEDEVAQSGSGAYLGIYGMDINSESSIAYNIPVGVYVTQAIEGEAADQAGIRKGDVITAINDTSVSSMSALKSVLSGMNPGDSVKLTVCQVNKGYKQSQVDVVLGEVKDDDKAQNSQSEEEETPEEHEEQGFQQMLPTPRQ